MKLSTKIFLPIILISALLILLSGCIPTTTPSPGVTTEGGTITGIFEVPEACCYSNRDHTEGWVPLVDATVSVIDSKGVTHTTKTDSDGKYWLTDVAPGIYYVVTACCACEDMEGVYKDVVEELKEGETYDAGIADCESTALGLIVDFLLSGDVYVDEDCNYYCNCFDEDSQIYASLKTVGTKLRALAINLQSIPEKPLEEIKANADFQEFVVELCDLLEACCVEPGVTPIPPPPPPPPDPCLGNTAPDITDPLEGSLIPANEGVLFTYDVEADDDPTQTLTFTLDQASIDRGMTIDPVTGVITWPNPTCDCLERPTDNDIAPSICSYPVTVTVEDECHLTDTVDFAIEVTCCTYTLTMAVSPAGAGTTVPSVGPHLWYCEGEVVDIMATPNAHYEFVNWTGDVADPNLASTTVTMDADKTVTANFTPSSWTEEDGLRVAFEDLPDVRQTCNDWDYNDWVGDINIVYHLLGPDKLTGIDFTITHVEHLAGYHHEFHLIIPGGGVGGTYDLDLSTGNALASGVNDIEVIPDTSTASGDYVLKIYYAGAVAFNYNSYEFDPVNIHGEGLFFEPLLEVSDTGESIGKDDIRMLTVPLGWEYPGVGVPIWTVYTEVGSAAGPACPYPVFDFPFPGTWNWIGP